jgi:putative FmdB family regulatory protein
MPIYEFVCESCGRQLSVFQRRIGAELNPECPHCQSRALRRLISRFAVLRSVDDAFDDSALEGLDENDPRAMERWARQMGEELGEDLGADDEDLGGFGAGDDLGDGGLDDFA